MGSWYPCAPFISPPGWTSCSLFPDGRVILADSSARASSNANCFKRFPDVGISDGRDRYGEISAVLDVRREDGLRADDIVEDVTEETDAADSAAD